MKIKYVKYQFIKLVNEIKVENELLQVYNNELKEEIEELRKQMVMAGEPLADGVIGGVNDQTPTLHSSMYHEHENDNHSTVSSSRMDEDSIEGVDAIMMNTFGGIQNSTEKGINDSSVFLCFFEI